ncbi:arsenate reductase family protein [Nitratifractor salsuginis]|uniref:Arsenate reductase and related protein n=1 Tax=Nitratifractor salsuginis (strain DSM 16511 / JCM 12458 / E9I37-1) TaxID=749222 RepID=E6WZW5_NITSE|nr:Spx/MgsR family RNA polymerase-binding regulatory protein [Nitratifractor salsuginis]ADV45623.1 arsenate reductase and related protein [Nitratifractor salsuginis DSM 16511]
MIKVYGIKTCDTVRKALKFLKEKGVEFEFVDFKKTPVGCEKIDEWLQKVDINTLFNKRGTKYRMLKLKELDLDEAGMREWLCKENLLIKRPVIELEDGRVIVGFDPERYEEISG